MTRSKNAYYLSRKKDTTIRDETLHDLYIVLLYHRIKIKSITFSMHSLYSSSSSSHLPTTTAVAIPSPT